MWTWFLNWGTISSYLVIGTCPMTSDDLKIIHTEWEETAVALRAPSVSSHCWAPNHHPRKNRLIRPNIFNLI
jgi:hypothetical protein